MLNMRLWIVSFLMVACAAVSFAETPTLYIIGDSTVESREGADADAQQGWGGKIDRYFKGSKVEIQNRAIGGRSSRSFRREGRWQKVLDLIKPGDFVMIQFGHNDGGGLSKDNGRTSLKGMGDETQDVTAEDGTTETVHTYGWYMKQYIREAKEKGATVIVCSPVPRCIWDEKTGKCGRGDKGYGGWSRQAAKDEDAWFINLDEIVAQLYDKVGDEEEVREMYFADHHTHTNRKGAEANARCVISGLRGLRNCPLYNCMNSKGLKVPAYRE